MSWVSVVYSSLLLQEAKGRTATEPRGRNALAFAYQSKHLIGLSACFFLNPVLAFLYLFSMRRLAFILFQRDCILLFSTCAFAGLKMKKHASVGELRSDGSKKSASAVRLCMASLVSNFLDLIYLCIDHTRIILNNTHSLLVNKNKANAFNTSLA